MLHLIPYIDKNALSIHNNKPNSLAIAILMQVPQADLIGLWLADVQ
jgi:hypothetical protein